MKTRFARSFPLALSRYSLLCFIYYLGKTRNFSILYCLINCYQGAVHATTGWMCECEMFAAKALYLLYLYLYGCVSVSSVTHLQTREASFKYNTYAHTKIHTLNSNPAAFLVLNFKCFDERYTYTRYIHTLAHTLK